MATDQSEHYVVTIDVKRSVRPASIPASRSLGDVLTAKPERVVEDVTHLVFRSSTLHDALAKASAHLSLMNDEDEGTP